MREILFRGKRTDDTGWIEGFYFQKPNPKSEDGLPVYHGISDLPPFGAEVIPETVGQYTGLKDKNGKKIFEDDIVKSNIALWGKDKYVVSFEETRGGWYPFACGDGCGCCEAETISTEHVTVIGNIHDNLELAEGAYE